MGNFLLTCGSYEKSLYGVEISLVKEDSGWKIISSKVAFALPAHSSHIKCITSNGSFLASGSPDETVRLFNLSKRKDHGTLSLHSGTITNLSLIKSETREFLLSASLDGMVAICLKHGGDWECIQKLRCHKHGVTAMAVHPSGKLVLTSGMDKKLKLWDLIKGKLCHSELSPFLIDGIQWSRMGDYYALYGEKNLFLYHGKTSAVLYELKSPPFKILSAAFLNDEALLVGGEGSNIIIIPTNITIDANPIIKSTSQKPRIKCISTMDNFVFTASSDGNVLIWDGLNFDSPLHTIDTGLRITCLTVCPLQLKK